MATGEQAIGTLKPGNQVWAYNQQTKQMELEVVRHLWVTQDNDLVDLTLTTKTTATKDKSAHETSETVHTNKKHPFLTVEKGFLPVAQLKLGMHVVEADGRVGVVTGWKSVPGIQTMYNLEVTRDHTYTVGDGQWVVHNSCLSGGTLAEDELAGGHTLAKHVAISEEDAYLRAVVNSPANGVGAFYSESTANEAVKQALQTTSFVDGGRTVFQATLKKSIGYVYDVAGNRWETSTVRVILSKSGSFITSAYPTVKPLP